MTFFYIGLFAMFASIFISRFMIERSLKKLTIEEKGKLLDLSSKYRIYNIVSLLVLMILFFLVYQFELINQNALFISYLIVFTIYLIIISYLNIKSLKENNYPTDYITSNYYSSFIRILGVLIFFVCMYFEMFNL